MNKPVPPLRVRVTSPYLPNREDYSALLDAVFKRRWLTNAGPCERELEARLARLLDADHLQLTSSGTSALQLAFAVLDLSGEVIMTPYSYAATRNAAARQGCDAVFVDIGRKNFSIDPEQIEAAITDRTRAVVGTSVYGLPCDFAEIQSIADRHGLVTIYDQAHAVGARLNGRALASYGDVSAVSFHATKVFHTVEGGGVICKDPDLNEKMRIMKSNGIDGDNVPYIGFNAKMSEMHAAMGLAILPELDEIIEARKERFDAYRSGLMHTCAEMIQPETFEGLDWNYAYAPAIFPTGDMTRAVQVALRQQGIESRRYFRPSINTLHKGAAVCPVAEDLVERVLCLPLSPTLPLADVEEICSILRTRP